MAPAPSSWPRTADPAPSAPSTTPASARTLPPAVSNTMSAVSGSSSTSWWSKRTSTRCSDSAASSSAWFERGAADRVDRPRAVERVRLEVERSLDRVDHPPAHRQGVGHDRPVEVDAAQCVETALGDRQVDRSPALRCAGTRVRTPFVDAHRLAPPREVAREQAAGEAATDDGDVWLAPGRVTIAPRGWWQAPRRRASSRGTSSTAGPARGEPCQARERRR